MLESIQQWDNAIFIWLNQTIANPALDYLFAIVASQRFWMPLIIAGVIALALRGGFRGRAFIILAALSLAIGDGLVNSAIREVVQKPRPHEVEIGSRQVGLAKEFPPELRIRVRKRENDNPGGSSFTSGHVLNNASVAAIAIALWPRLWLPLAAWVLLICLSRIYNGAHYPIDVLGSLPIALLVAWAVCKSSGAIIWLLRKKLPRLHSRWNDMWRKSGSATRSAS